MRRSSVKKREDVDTSLPRSLRAKIEEQNEKFRESVTQHRQQIEMLEEAIRNHKECCAELIPKLKLKQVQDQNEGPILNLGEW